MGILQTVWTALTNENEFLLNIICIPLTFIEAYLYMMIFINLLNIVSTLKQRIIFVLIFSLISIFNMFFANNLYYTFVNVLSMPVLVYFIFKASILKSIFSELVTYIIVFIVSTPLMLLYSNIFNVSSSVATTIPIHKICLCVLLYIFLYIFYRICQKHNINISIIDKFKNKNSLLLILNFIIGSISIGIESYILFNYIDYMPNILVITSLVVLLTYFILSIFSLIRTNKLEVTTQSLEEQKLYNKTLITLHDNIRGFKHDFDNIVQALGGYITTNNMEGLKIYYKDLLEECQINNNLAVLNPELINNPAIYSLLADKYYKAEKLKIKLNLEVMADLSNINVKIYELSRILGILLDNAIEAASKCKNKIVNVIFRQNSIHNKLLIIIQNSYINTEIDINKIFEKGYTSKEDDNSNKSHGLGLWEVKKYLSKNTNLDLFTTKSDKLFTQQFEIYN